jgi:hypothetical protein
VEAKLPGLAASFSNSLQVLTPPPTSLNPPKPSMKLKIDFLRDCQQAGHQKNTKKITPQAIGASQHPC